MQPSPPPDTAGCDPTAGADRPVPPQGAQTSPGRPPDWGPPWIGPIRHRSQIDLAWLLVVVLLVVPGMAFFGWRALEGVCITALATLVTHTLVRLVLRRIWPRHAIDSSLHVLVLGLLMGLALPAVCRSAIPLVAGIVLGVVCHLVGRSHRLRVHPVAAAMLSTWLISVAVNDPDVHNAFSNPEAVLRPERVVIGDLCDLNVQVDNEPWLSPHGRSGPHDAITRLEPSRFLQASQEQVLANRSAMARFLMTGQLLPMADVLLGAVPGPVGGSSRAVLIALGLYVIYRRLAWWPLAVSAATAAAATLLVMPVAHQGQITLVAVRLADLSPTVVVTYTAYMILCSQLAMTVLILAPHTAPTSSSGRLMYGAIIGALMIVVQWFWVVPVAGHVSLFAAGLLSRPLDALHRCRFVS